MAGEVQPDVVALRLDEHDLLDRDEPAALAVADEDALAAAQVARPGARGPGRGAGNGPGQALLLYRLTSYLRVTSTPAGDGLTRW